MLKIGINGLGRIGKCVLLQLLLSNHANIEIKAINVTKLNIDDLEDYLAFDTFHSIHTKFQVQVLSPNSVQIGKHIIHYVQERDNKKIDWLGMGVDYLIDCTGAFLTEEKCKGHNAPYTIISSPAKDSMPTFIYGVNHTKYSGQTIVSGSSCTTNCLAPMLQHLDNVFGVNNCVFTTVHAATASQYVTDVIQKGARTDRSIFNNIIPHTTGASSSVISVLPHLQGKVFGTSVRVPVGNCSLVDAVIELKQPNINLQMIHDSIESSEFNKVVLSATNKKRVSSDFCTTTIPSILDVDASMELDNNKFKLFLWYDNEWSYSAQLIRLVETMFEKNSSRFVDTSRFVDDLYLQNKGVVCRFDFNVPLQKDGTVADTFRLDSTLSTVKSILNKGAKYIVLVSHFGRPKGYDAKYSTHFLIPFLSNLYKQPVQFLPDGVSLKSIETIQSNPSGIFLLENIRFHPEETVYEYDPNSCLSFLDIYKNLGDVFISDAFGCAHRKHLSVHAFSTFSKPFGYGHLIKRELDFLTALTSFDSNKRVLGIIGGNKVEDKLPVIESLKRIPNSQVYVAGGLATKYIPVPHDENVFVMQDGFGSDSLYETSPRYVNNLACKPETWNCFDIGTQSLTDLFEKIKNSDVIFWNGSLGVIEHPVYKLGSESLALNLLENTSKQVLIGGGETASLFGPNLPNHVYVSTGGGALLEYLRNKILLGKGLVGLDIFF